MERLYGRTIIPPQVAQFEFREKKIKEAFGLKDSFDVYQERKEVHDKERPPVVINPALVFVERRPSNSNRFMEVNDKFVKNRPEIRSGAQGTFSRQGVILKRYPISTRLDNYITTDADGMQTQRQLMK